MPVRSLYARSTLESDGLLDFIRSLGGDPEAIAEDAGLMLPPYNAKIHFNSWAAQCRFYEIAAERLDEPYLGLKWAFAMPEDYHNSGPTIFLGSIASNVRHFLDMLIKYQKTHTNGAAYSYEEDVDRNLLIGVFNIHPYSPPHRQMVEQIMGGLTVMGRRFGPNFELKSVTFQHNAPRDLDWYEKTFECDIQFNANRNTLVLSRDFLKEKRTRAVTKIMSPFLRTYLTVQARKNPKSAAPITLLIAEILPNILGSKNSDIATIAEVLNIHPKKLQRLLGDEGTSYSQITDDVKKNLAARLLSQSDMPIGKIANMLDYSSDRSFGLAMKRWFALSPSDYRKFGTGRGFHT